MPVWQAIAHRDRREDGIEFTLNLVATHSLLDAREEPVVGVLLDSPPAHSLVVLKQRNPPSASEDIQSVTEEDRWSVQADGNDPSDHSSRSDIINSDQGSP
jgi:hypothetical protein